MIPEPRLGSLYQEVILDHNKRPRNFRVIPDAHGYSHGVNPLCGDDYHIYLKVENGTVTDIGFQGSGCAISKASASMLTTLVKEKSLGEARALRAAFLDLMTKEPIPDAAAEKAGRLKIFLGVREFPVRVKCATLAWQALGDALKDLPESKS